MFTGKNQFKSVLNRGSSTRLQPVNSVLATSTEWPRFKIFVEICLRMPFEILLMDSCNSPDALMKATCQKTHLTVFIRLHFNWRLNEGYMPNNASNGFLASSNFYISVQTVCVSVRLSCISPFPTNRYPTARVSCVPAVFSTLLRQHLQMASYLWLLTSD